MLDMVYAGNGSHTEFHHPVNPVVYTGVGSTDVLADGVNWSGFNFGTWPYSGPAPYTYDSGYVAGDYNSINGGAGWNSFSVAGNNNFVGLGAGQDNYVSLIGGSGNFVVGGWNNNTVADYGGSNALLSLQNGWNNNITLQDVYGDTVLGGSGNDHLVATGNRIYADLGAGNNSADVSGYGNIVTNEGSGMVVAKGEITLDTLGVGSSSIELLRDGTSASGYVATGDRAIFAELTDNTSVNLTQADGSSAVVLGPQDVAQALTRYAFGYFGGKGDPTMGAALAPDYPTGQKGGGAYGSVFQPVHTSMPVMGNANEGGGPW